MAKRRAPWNPNTADWLVAQRGKRKQDEVVADLQARGVALKRSWLSRIENGEPFSDDLLDAFIDYYGSVPPPYEPPTEEQPADLAAAISALTIELQAARKERETYEARLRAVEAELVSLRARRGGGASSGQPFPLTTAGSGPVE